MNNDHNEPGGVVPGQYEGAETNAVDSVIADTVEEAKTLFERTKARLLDIDHWHSFSGIASAKFHLTDEQGNELRRPPRKGDLICIDIPGPGNAAGDGNDWVRIEALEEETSLVGDMESISMRVRPASNPKSSSNETAHFYSSDATSSYIIKREGNKVSAAEHGRNEVPNTDAGKVLDKARNVAVALGGMAGMSKAQWKALVKGLLKDE